MASGQRILKNSVFLSASQIAAKVINFALIIILTRYLGKNGFGLYSYSFAYVSIFYFMSHMGISNLLVRDVAKHRESAQEYISYSLPLVLILSTGFLVIVNVIPIISNWSNDERLITLFFSFYFLFDALAKYAFAIMQAFERMGMQAILFASERLFLLLTSLYCWYSDRSLLILVAVFAVVNGIKAMTAFIFVQKEYTKLSFSWSAGYFRSLLKESYPFALVLLFSALSTRVDILMLKEFHSTASVAIYNTARKIIDAFSFLPENIYAAVFPSLSLLFISQKEKFNEAFRQAFLAILLIAIPICTGFFVLAPRIIDILFDPEFQDAYIPLRWLSLGLLFIYIRMGLSVTLNATGNQHIFALIYGISMIVSVVMNFILIPRYDTLGASMTVILSEISLILCSMPFIKRQVNFSWGIFLFPKLIIVTLILAFTIFLLQEYHLAIILIILITEYIGLIIAFKIFTRAELRQYYRILTRRGNTEL